MSAPLLYDLEAASTNMSAGNASLITAKSLLIVKISSTSGLGPDEPALVTNSEARGRESRGSLPERRGPPGALRAHV